MPDSGVVLTGSYADQLLDKFFIFEQTEPAEKGGVSILQKEKEGIGVRE